MWLGSLLGSLLAVAEHFLRLDSPVALLLQEKWHVLWPSKISGDVGAYSIALVALCVSVAAIALPTVLMWFWRFARSWWAGIASMTTPISALGTFALLNYGSIRPGLTGVAGLTLIATLFALEYRRQAQPAQTLSGDLKLKIPISRASASESRWEAHTSDDPINDWSDDIIGRIAVVELLAEHALRLHTPIVALNGGLGDGKSSVLNLLRKAVEGQAIVISFRAWLPGSETTLATDLFRDITTECKRYVYVPQLRKTALAFARTVSGSVSQLGGLKELIPAQSQREEIEELHGALLRIPRPILVLLDEIDRMQRDELLVLLKILRGASSIKNVTFICAFSEESVKIELNKGGQLSDDYLEKFFPISVRLTQPTTEIVGRCFRVRLQQRLLEQKWFRTDQDATEFETALDNVWTDSLDKVLTNLRKAGMLLNDIIASGQPIAGEVNPLDLVMIEAIRRFSPQIYQRVRTSARYLVGTPTNPYFSEEKDKNEFFKNMTSQIGQTHEADAIRILLCWLFPEYAKASGASIWSSVRRPRNDGLADSDKRICSESYFQIYFRAAVPEEMFSNAESEELILNLNEAGTDGAVETVFKTQLESIPTDHPKRADFLWRLVRIVGRLNDATAEWLAYAVAKHADEYQYDIVNLGQGAYAQNIVFAVAQKLSATPTIQRVLGGAMIRASHDRFSVRLLDGIENPSRNRILTDFSHVNTPGLKGSFARRMRDRYGPLAVVDLSKSDWFAFRNWVEASDDDRNFEQDFWRRFIGRSRKRLAQAINVIYPGGIAWSDPPRPIVDQLFPIKEIMETNR